MVRLPRFRGPSSASCRQSGDELCKANIYCFLSLKNRMGEEMGMAKLLELLFVYPSMELKG